MQYREDSGRRSLLGTTGVRFVYGEWFESFFSGDSTRESTDWVLFVETADAEEITRVREFLEEWDVEYVLERENKPLWEPYPHSTEKIYVRDQDLGELRRALRNDESTETVEGDVDGSG